jgi:cell division protein FtsW
MAAMVGMQPNISNAALIIMLACTMLFIGGCRLRHLAAFAASAVVAAAPFMFRMEHVRQRISAVLGRCDDFQGQGWHLKQSLIAFGSGFIFGCGPGRGHQKYLFLPDAHTDFIYSIIGEEMGIVGTVSVLILFTLILRRSILIARRAPNEFGRFLALGIGITLFASAIINMAMTTGLIPTAGLPLPFVSYGGSSLVTSLSAAGVLLNISIQGRDRERSVARGRTRSMENASYARRTATGALRVGGRRR